MTCWPSRSVSFCAMSRAMKSVPPPGANGAMMRTGLVGYCWLWARPAARASTAKIALRRIIAENTYYRKIHRQSCSSGAPPAPARSSCFTLSVLNLPARSRIVFSTSSSGGGSPLIQRSGLMRAMTKARRYGADEAARLQPGDDRGDALVELKEHLRLPLVNPDDFRNRLVREGHEPAHDGVVGRAGEFRIALVAHTERDQRSLFQIEGKLRLRPRTVFVDQPAVDADDFQRALAQVVRLLRVEREDLPGDLALRHDQRGDRPRAEAPHRLQPVPAVRRPEPLARRRDRDHRVEEQAGAVDDVGEPARSEERRVGKECRSRWSPYH